MSNPKVYGVQKDGRWLKLVGPFKYAEWVEYKSSLTEPMTYGEACAWRDAYGGEVRSLA